MAKQSGKVVADKQTESQRGKSRFAVQSRSTRVVLPDRPPRQVDNEIVSILLGGDPASLSVQDAPGTPVSQIAEFIAPKNEPETLVPIQHIHHEEKAAPEESSLLQQADALPSTISEEPQIDVNDSRLKISPVPETYGERSKVRIKSESSVLTSKEMARSPSSSPSDIRRGSARTANETEELAITSFEEFIERWKHGLRKGQLKVCEVLYQKTYALGVTECVTSFSELGRLSGIKMRQCFNIIAQLEALKFVERAKSEATSNKKDQGSIIRFFLFPKN